MEVLIMAPTKMVVDVMTGEAAHVELTPEEIAALPPPAAPEPLPPIVLTNRQLFAALALTGFITWEEALAAGRTGAVPTAIDDVFAELPEQAANLARLTWATMREVSRDHALIGMMIAANLATAEQVDAVFALGASIE
jgi:hypothetical protein